jgi:hypothetical protein
MFWSMPGRVSLCVCARACVHVHRSDAQLMFLNHADAGLMNRPLLLDRRVHNRNYKTTLLEVSSQETSMQSRIPMFGVVMRRRRVCGTPRLRRNVWPSSVTTKGSTF